MTMIQKLTDLITGHHRLTLTENGRMLVLLDGKFDSILQAGKHRLPSEGVETEYHDLDYLFFMSMYEKLLKKNRPDIVAEHLTEYRAQADEVVVLKCDGSPVRVLPPNTQAMAWNDAGQWEDERYALSDTMEVPADVARRLRCSGQSSYMIQVEVAQGHIGLLTVDGVQVGQLEPGLHAFWNTERKIAVKQIDLSQRAHEVKG